MLIAGLGNPGPKYEKTRHNIGFMVLDQLADDLGVKLNEKCCAALIGRGSAAGKEFVLLKPQTYMNLSGESVLKLLSHFGCDSSKLLVVMDDLDLPLGRLRIRASGGDGGHKGLRSIIDSLKTKEIPRLRIGVGRPVEEAFVEDYVLSEFMQEETAVAEQVILTASEAIRVIITENIKAAMNRYNGWRYKENTINL